MAKTTITVLMLLCASAGALSRSRTYKAAWNDCAAGRAPALCIGNSDCFYDSWMSMCKPTACFALSSNHSGCTAHSGCELNMTRGFLPRGGIVEQMGVCVQTQAAASAAASIRGDPHMQNVRGEKQDLLAPGTYNILELPSGNGDSLSLIGEVSYIDHPTFCNPLFLTKLRIIGTALGNQEFKFDLGNSSDAQSFSVTRTNMRNKKSEFFQVSEPINKQFGPVGLSTAQCKKGQVGENSKNCWDSFNTMALKLLGKNGNFLTLSVRRGGQLGFFDVQANGLDALGMSVGGLLGINGFTSLGTSTDKTCHNKRRSELKSLLQNDDHVHIEQSLLMAKM